MKNLQNYIDKRFLLLSPTFPCDPVALGMLACPGLYHEVRHLEDEAHQSIQEYNRSYDQVMEIFWGFGIDVDHNACMNPVFTRSCAL